MIAGSTVNGAQVSATMAMATVVQTRSCLSCTLRLLSKVANTSWGPMACNRLLHHRLCAFALIHSHLCDVAESVDCRASNRLLVCLEQLEQFETDAHPFTGRDELGAAVCNRADQVDAVLLDFLVTILQNRGQSEMHRQ